MRRRNVKWRAADATELELPAAGFDVVFSNWLLMYLSDAEVSKLASDALRWVRRPEFAYLLDLVNHFGIGSSTFVTKNPSTQAYHMVATRDIELAPSLQCALV